MDPLGNVTDPQAKPVRETTVRENEVLQELNGWYARRCDLNAADAPKQLALYSTPRYDGTVELSYQYQSGEALQKAQAWEARAEAARQGVLLYDQLAQRDPAFTSDQAIKALIQRASAIGLVAYENQTRQLGPRF
jgi:hypothetical protein